MEVLFSVLRWEKKKKFKVCKLERMKEIKLFLNIIVYIENFLKNLIKSY